MPNHWGKLQTLGLVGLLLLHFACATQQRTAQTAAKPEMETGAAAYAPAILAHWSQIVRDPVAAPGTWPLVIVARFVVDGAGADCGDFEMQPVPVGASGATRASTRSVTADPAFPITVCQLEMNDDWNQGTLLAQGDPTVLATFPGPHRVGRIHPGELVAVGIGDTGCRASDCDADGGVNVRFKNVIGEVLTAVPAPDFVLHVGDYRYYEENSEPDSWDKWKMDFFAPAQPLLNVAPVAFVRGNHEQCTGDEGYWYGVRFFQFFEPTTSEQVASCDEGTPNLLSTWAFDVGVYDTSDMEPWSKQRIVMIDDSPDSKNFPSSRWPQVVSEISANFADALAAGQGARDVWWLTHKPLWNYPNQYANPATQTAVFEALGNHGSIDYTLCDQGQCTPRAILSGHAHNYQQTDFGNVDWPIQYVLGHGGVQPLTGTDASGLEYDYSVPSAFGSETYAGDTTAVFNQNGFLRLTRSPSSLTTPSGWIVEDCLLGKTCVKVSP